MNEAIIERVAKHLASSNGDPAAWGAYAHRAIEAIEDFPIVDEAMWQPMDSAPMDGEGLLLAVNNYPGTVHAATWNENLERGWSLWGLSSVSFNFDVEYDEVPTRWRPLPKPPKT